MVQSNSGNYHALDWVQSEIQKSLASALKDFAESIHQPDNKVLLNACISELHQLIGTLDILDLPGAMQLAKEILASTIALRDKRANHLAELQDSILKGLLLLPNYLLLLSPNLQDHPLRLIDTVNELRANRDEPSISPLSLFKPNMSTPLPLDITPNPDRAVPNTKLSPIKIYHLFQASLLHWLKHNDPASLRKMNNITHFLRLSCIQEKTTLLWWVTEGVIESLLDNSLVLTTDIRRSLGKLNQSVKCFTEDGEQGLLTDFPKELVKDLLFIIAVSSSNGKNTMSLQKSFKLMFFNAHQQQQIYTFGDDALTEAYAALLEQIQKIKDKLEHSEGASLSANSYIGDQLSSLALTLDLLSESSASEAIKEQSTVFQSLSSQQTLADHEQCSTLADTLLKVEEYLQKDKHTEIVDFDISEHKRLQKTVVIECLVDLETIKETLILLSDHHADPSSMELLPQQLKNIAGSLSILELDTAAELLHDTSRQITQMSASNEAFSSIEWSLFAEIIAATDLYLEGLSKHDQQQDNLLESALELIANFDLFVASRTEELNNLPPKINIPDRDDFSTEITDIEFDSIPAPEELESFADEIVLESESEFTLDERPKTSVESYIKLQSINANYSAPITEQSETSVEKYIKLHSVIVKEEAALTSVEGYTQQHSDVIVTEETSVERYINLNHSFDDVMVAEETEINTNESVFSFAEDVDAEIAEIFIEEAHDTLELLYNLLLEWNHHHNIDTLTTIRRYFHSLKGSGRMAKANVIGELAWSIEQLLNSILSGSQSTSPMVEKLLADTIHFIPELLTLFGQGFNASTEYADELTLIAQEYQEQEQEQEQEQDIVDEIAGDDNTDSELQHIFYQEANQHIATFNRALANETIPFKLNKEFLRAAHSLKGCAAIANVQTVMSVSIQLDQSLRLLYEKNTTIDEELLSVLQSSIDGITHIVTEGQSHLIDNSNIQSLLADLIDVTPEESDEASEAKLIDPEFLVTYLEETDELLESYSEQLAQLQQNSNDQQLQELTQKTLATLTANAYHLNLTHIATIYHLLSQLVEKIATQSPQITGLLEEGYELLNTQIEALIQNKPAESIISFNQHVIDHIDQLNDATELNNDSTNQDIHAGLSDEESTLLAGFIEECGELIESCGQAIHQWRNNNNDLEALSQLQRDLHTIKGGALMTGVNSISDLAHHIEGLIQVASGDDTKLNTDFFDLLQRNHEHLTDLQLALVDRTQLNLDHDLLLDIEQFADSDATNDNDDTVNNNLKPITKLTEQVRIPATFLDFMTNFTGEANISRDRVSLQNTAIRQQLTEMESTVARLQAQFRNLEIETETQILFRYEDELLDQKLEVFDPLELDRFSMIQQLSRGLTESVSDLNDITHSLDTLIGDSDTILLQQSLLAKELQQGLMQTRLVPFREFEPRFDRVIRQSNSELGLSAVLTITGLDFELDRSILNRLSAPLEHILRNAITHGVEDEGLRLALGKPAQGQITLSIAREGSEILVTVTDDGRGLNFDAIKQKAIEHELISVTESTSSEQLIQFILGSGFSTAEEVSQLAGRGVGLDVVNREIRALKGRLSIQSTANRGVIFSIRLPLSLSVMQALLVDSYDQQYALPLSSIHTTERISVRDINTLYSHSEDPHYRYGGLSYRFIPLSTMLGHPFSLPEDLEEQLPLLLFRAGDINVALLIESITSSREIVLKSVGEQLNTIPAISGATILGDGNVAFILDIPALEESNRAEAEESQARPRQTRHTPVALIVDDSITMRKASGNLLKRQGFDIITARDGVDAVAQLNLQIPDVILLDIEMPRMDGFEFATLVRNDAQYHGLPIIMITSRTGDKHRERAKELNVDAYLGKPYQEEQLVNALKDLLGNSYPNSGY